MTFFPQSLSHSSSSSSPVPFLLSSSVPPSSSLLSSSSQSSSSFFYISLSLFSSSNILLGLVSLLFPTSAFQSSLKILVHFLLKLLLIKSSSFQLLTALLSTSKLLSKMLSTKSLKLLNPSKQSTNSESSSLTQLLKQFKLSKDLTTSASQLSFSFFSNLHPSTQPSTSLYSSSFSSPCYIKFSQPATHRFSFSTHKFTFNFILFIFILASFGSKLEAIRLTEPSKTFVVEKGDSIILKCTFEAAVFNLFDYPIMWKKQQLNEITQINTMGNINKEFLGSNRFEVTFDSHTNINTFSLRIEDIIEEDSGNYTCEIRGPQSFLMATLTHALRVSVPVLHIKIDDSSHNSASSSSSSLSSSSPSFSSSISPPSSSSSSSLYYDVSHNMTMKEYEHTSVQCTSYGGNPPPQLHVFLHQQNITNLFQRLSLQTSFSSGKKPFRKLLYVTKIHSPNVKVGFENDGNFFRCAAILDNGGGLEVGTYINVYYAPRIFCRSSEARVNDVDVSMFCHVTAKPPITALKLFFNNKYSNDISVNNNVNTNNLMRHKSMRISNHLHDDEMNQNQNEVNLPLKEYNFFLTPDFFSSTSMIDHHNHDVCLTFKKVDRISFKRYTLWAENAVDSSQQDFFLTQERTKRKPTLRFTARNKLFSGFTSNLHPMALIFFPPFNLLLGVSSFCGF